MNKSPPHLPAAPAPQQGSATAPAKNGNWYGMVASLAGLVLLCVLWEGLLSPLRPGSHWLALKAVPLLIPLHGAIKQRVYTIQWSSMLIWLYFTEGVVRGFRNPNPLDGALAGIELALALSFFVCALLYLRPIKQAAKNAAKQAAIQAANQAENQNAATPPAPRADSSPSEPTP
jgi:uncharacterized membrane protein